VVVVVVVVLANDEDNDGDEEEKKRRLTSASHVSPPVCVKKVQVPPGASSGKYLPHGACKYHHNKIDGKVQATMGVRRKG